MEKQFKSLNTTRVKFANVVHFRVVSLEVYERFEHSEKAAAMNRGHKARTSAQENQSIERETWLFAQDLRA